MTVGRWQPRGETRSSAVVIYHDVIAVQKKKGGPGEDASHALTETIPSNHHEAGSLPESGPFPFHPSNWFQRFTFELLQYVERLRYVCSM